MFFMLAVSSIQRREPSRSSFECIARPTSDTVLTWANEAEPRSGSRVRLIDNHGADRLALLHQIEAFVDTLERQMVRDQIVDVDLAFHVPVDDLRHVGTAPCAAERRALPF